MRVIILQFLQCLPILLLISLSHEPLELPLGNGQYSTVFSFLWSSYHRIFYLNVPISDIKAASFIRQLTYILRSIASFRFLILPYPLGSLRAILNILVPYLFVWTIYILWSTIYFSVHVSAVLGHTLVKHLRFNSSYVFDL